MKTMNNQFSSLICANPPSSVANISSPCPP
jgi:hypothetical protein